MNFRIRSLVVALLLTCSLATAAEAPALSADKQRVIDFTRYLESEPAAADARERAAWLIDWITKAPDVEVLVCDTAGLLSDDRKSKFRSHLVVQGMFGMAAWAIEHPGSKPASVEMQVAGVRSTLRTYASVLKLDPAERFPSLDLLAEHEGKGDLEQHLAPIVADKCSKKG